MGSVWRQRDKKAMQFSLRVSLSVLVSHLNRQQAVDGEGGSKYEPRRLGRHSQLLAATAPISPDSTQQKGKKGS
jgi:hypothetical protein